MPREACHARCERRASTVHMQPMKHPIHADASLISMLEPTGSNQLGNALNRRSQPLGGQFVPRKPGRFRDLAPTDRGESLTGASRGKQLPLVQIHVFWLLGTSVMYE